MTLGFANSSGASWAAPREPPAQPPAYPLSRGSVAPAQPLGGNLPKRFLGGVWGGPRITTAPVEVFHEGGAPTTTTHQGQGECSRDRRAGATALGKGAHVDSVWFAYLVF